MATLVFDYGIFAQEMNINPRWNKKDHGQINWYDKSSHAMKYYADNGLDYRTWRPDTSLARAGVALLVSVKIDQPRAGGDDHVVMLASFNTACEFVTAQAAVQHEAKKSVSGEVIVATPGLDMPGAIQSSVQKSIDELRKGKSDVGFEYLSFVAETNLYCMRQAVKYR